MQTELSRKNIFVRYYKFTYGLEARDICSLTHGTILSLLLSIFMLPGRLLLRRDLKYTYGLHRLFVSTILGALLYLVLFTIIQLGNASLELFGYEFTHWTGVVFGGFGLGALLIGIMLGIIIGIWYIWNKIYEYRYKRAEKKFLERLNELESGEVEIIKRVNYMQGLIDIIAAIRGKYCVKITYKD